MTNLDLKFSDVSLNYGNYQALKNVSFSLTGGKVYGLIGRNGAGKTTLLSLLASLRQTSSGSIRVGQEDPFDNHSIMPLISFIYDMDYSDEYDSIQRYFDFAERYRPYFDRQYALNLAEQFKLPLRKEIRTFSRGMQSALNVTLGLASRSPITIFDEVYLSMDAPTRERFYGEVIEDQSNHPRTMILSTHLVSEMEYLFDHVLVLDQGKLIIDEPYDEVITRGASITGDASLVDQLTMAMQILSSKQLGPTKSVMIYGKLSDADRSWALERGLEIGPVALQDLFIGLTEEDSHATKE